MPDKRVFLLADGRLSVAGFLKTAEKDGQTVQWHQVIFSRSYQDEKLDWRRSNYFSLRDLFTIRRLVDAAIDKLIILDGKPNGELRDYLCSSAAPSSSGMSDPVNGQEIPATSPAVGNGGEIPF